MKLRITNNLILTSLIFVFLLFFSGCYTQLAKPDSNRAEQDTYAEKPEEYGEEPEEYYEDEEYGEDYDYEDYDEGDIEDYDEIHITRRYYSDTYVYGGYPSPWYYDPFYDPYFYDSYTPYSSHVSIHVGYRDPFFFGYHRRYYDPFYDPFYFGYYNRGYSYGYTSGFYFDGGCLRSGSYGYYGNYYPGQSVAVLGKGSSTTPFTKSMQLWLFSPRRGSGKFTCSATAWGQAWLCTGQRTAVIQM